MVEESFRDFYQMINQDLLYAEGEVDLVDESKDFRFYKTLLSISTLFLNDDLNQIDESVQTSFSRINEIVESERIQVHVFDLATNCCDLSYQYTEELIPKIDFQPVPLDLIQDLVSAMRKGQHIFIPSVHHMPEGLVKKSLQAQDTKSILLMPMRIREESIGFIAFEMLTEYKVNYSSEVISLLHIYANMLANLIVRSTDKERLKGLVERITIQNKRHSDFSFITSHNIRGSVANLLAIKDLVRDSLDDTYFDMLEQSVHQLNDSVLNINEILNGENESYLGKVDCDVRQSLNTILKSFRKTIEREGITIDNFIEKNQVIKTYPRYLESVFTQIIENSIKYSKREGKKEIAVKSAIKQDHFELTITDNGRGFDSERNKEKLFKVGARFHNDQCDGNGLGLFTAKMHVDAMGGDITLTSTEDAGTEVRIILPYQ